MCLTEQSHDTTERESTFSLNNMKVEITIEVHTTKKPVMQFPKRDQ